MNNKIKGILLMLPFIIIVIGTFTIAYIDDPELFIRATGVLFGIFALLIIGGTFLLGLKMMLSEDR